MDRVTKQKKRHANEKTVSAAAQDTLLSEIISILSVKTQSMSSQHFRVIGNVTWLWRKNTRVLFYSGSDYFSRLQKPEKMHQRQQTSLREPLSWLTAYICSCSTSIHSLNSIIKKGFLLVLKSRYTCVYNDTLCFVLYAVLLILLTIICKGWKGSLF